MNVSAITSPRKPFERATAAKYRRVPADSNYPLPEYPPLDADGTRNALDSIRVSIARRLIQDRVAARLSQKQLADLAGVRQETISRIESGKHTASIRTVGKLAKALRNVGPQKRTH